MKLSPSNKWKTSLGILYIALLFLSNGPAWFSDERPVQPIGPEWNWYTPAPSEAADGIQMAYRVLGPVDGGAGTVLFLHGTPMAGDSFENLLPLLEKEFRLLVPDIPGFGFSSGALKDYSFEAQADFLAGWIADSPYMDVHVVGYSQGGAAALHLLGKTPGRLASLTLVSGLGVQEYQFLGDYYLNHAFYSAQLAAIWCLKNLVPHFGVLDELIMKLPYARAFYDSDLRPSRKLMEQAELPVLIVHSPTDAVIPYDAALEHYRIMPQSRFAEVEGGHLAPLRNPKTISRHLERFFKEVASGEFPRRSSADPTRLEEAKKPFDWSRVPPAAGLTLLLLAIGLVVGTLVTEDLTCVVAGFLVARGSMSFTSAISAVMLGIFFGDILLYFAGRILGQPAIRKVPFKFFIREASLLQSEEWFEKRGPIVILLSRFIPGTRFPAYFVAGVLKTRFLQFTFYFVLSILFWTPILIWLSVIFGEKVLEYLKVYQQYSIQAACIAIGFGWLILEVGVPALSARGRRLLWGRWKRIITWEFWPKCLLYLPLLPYLLWLGIKHRSLTLFTCANPGIEKGHFRGEKKFELLEKLGLDEEYVARSFLIKKGAKGERYQDVIGLMNAHDLLFPVVLKPSSGESGRAVKVVTDLSSLERMLQEHKEELILQEFVPGPEFALFYCRKPDEEKGFIFSATYKEFPRIFGDGRHQLQDLILRDKRAVCVAPAYFGHLGQKIYQVPEKGEEIQLVDSGTHSRGAIFRDGANMVTTDLEEAIDAISKKFEGFYFGQFDIRVPSLEDFSAGRGIKILELNGVTAQSTNLFDASNSYYQAMAILRRQWRLAFEVGRQNRELGAVPVGILKLVWRLGQTWVERRNY